MSNKEHTLLCIMGETACGKDSLVEKLCERMGTKQLISYTTRNRRVGEGDTHRFVTEEDFNQMRAEGQIAAYTEIAGNHYWSTIDQLYASDFYIVDYNGVKTLKNLNLPGLRIVTVYVNTLEEIRRDRAINQRKDRIEDFRIRSFSEQAQFREMKKNVDFDYAVSNIDFAKAYSVIRWIATIEGILKNKEEEETK